MAEKRIAEKRGTGRRASARVTSADREHQVLELGKKNWILFLSGLASIALGFLLLRIGDITLAPILLLAGYLVLIPWALIARSKETKEGADRGGSPPA